MYERKTASNKAFLIRKLVNLKYKEGNSIAEHLNEIQSIVNQLTSMEMVLDDELQALLLLSSLPDSWETLVVSLSNSAPDGIVTMSQTIGDFDKVEKPQPYVDDLIDLDPVPSPMVHDDREDVQDHDDTVGDDAPTEIADHVDFPEQGEHPLPEPSTDPQIRKSSRQHKPSQKYSPLEYVLLTDEGEPENYQEAQEIKAQPFDYPIVNLSTSWTNNPSSINQSVNFTDGSMVRFVLSKGSIGSSFGCGFYCNGNCNNFIFAVLIFNTDPLYTPRVVWSANRNNPVRENATLKLTPEGDLILLDVDGTFVWSTNTTNKSVAGLSMTKTGNFVLFDRKNLTVWESFNHPTDSLLLGQALVEGQKLTSSVSEFNWTEGGLFSLFVTNEGLIASIKSNPSWAYFHLLSLYTVPKNKIQPSYVRFLNGSLALYILSIEPTQPADRQINVPVASSAQYLKLGSDGHLRVFEWVEREWKEVADLLTSDFGDCGYPMVCGNYGICSNGQCSCPGATNGEAAYFRQINDRQPKLGCSEVTPLSCEASQYHNFLELKDITYFSFTYDLWMPKDRYPYDLVDTDMETCKQVCLNNCSCKAALFQYRENSSSGNCFLPSQLFSLMNNEKEKTLYNSSAFMKVQISPIAQAPPSEASPTPVPSGKKIGWSAVILGSSLGAFFALYLIINIRVLLLRKKRDTKEDEEDYLDELPGMPTRFSFEDLIAATENFSRKLGQGGFGTPEGMDLLNLLKIKAHGEQLFDLLDKYNEDMQLHAVEAMEVMKIATWCLQSDFTRRPSMSVVVKVLEGVMDVEPNLDYSFSTLLTVSRKEAVLGFSTPIVPSVLSGPR
ncbi:hypothetical protein HHK36_001685 [Tetracentron sinense]|uniref:Receptor-like serine/threonine-protein kinase n=1 Tax=Tetracentron sinense TaxID=13715 RepID=A0A834ZYJ8_TETSI|nr:hypothetical protein HHK36_001685 [Tetracentron sinense]